METSPPPSKQLDYITESRARRVSKLLEKDPVFFKRLGAKDITIPKRGGGGGPVLHYPAVVDIIFRMRDAGIEAAEASKDQIMGFSCDYFGLARPASLDDGDDTPSAPPAPERVVEPVARQTPEPTVAPVAPVATVVPVTPVAPPAPKPIVAKIIPKPKPPTPEVKPTPQPEARIPVSDDGPKVNQGGITCGPEMAIYMLLVNCCQLAKLDKSKGAEERAKQLDVIGRAYYRNIAPIK